MNKESIVTSYEYTECIACWANRRLPNSMHLSDIINCKMRKLFIVLFESVDIEIVAHLQIQIYPSRSKWKIL